MDNQKYLEELIAGLMADETWEAPQEVKEMLCYGINWTLLDL